MEIHGYKIRSCDILYLLPRLSNDWILYPISRSSRGMMKPTWPLVSSAIFSPSDLPVPSFWGAAFATMTAADLSGLAKAWESDPEVREFMRVNQCLFRPAIRCAKPECNVRCGEQNFQALKPIAQRLRLPNGHVGQVMVPHLTRESFILNCIFYIFYFSFCLSNFPYGDCCHQFKV